ncbi:MAG: hypothetical protein AB7G15_16110 [Alphaproteobacteria bacterium]
MRLLRQLLKPLLLLGLVLTGNPAPATQDLIGGLPSHFCGSYVWHGFPDIQDVSISLTEAAALPDGKIEARGNGIFALGERMTRVKIRVLFNPADRRLEMWEDEPAPNLPDYITDGSYVGRLSDDSKRYEALWTTRGTRQTGTLRLEAKTPWGRQAQLCSLVTS